MPSCWRQFNRVFGPGLWPGRKRSRRRRAGMRRRCRAPSGVCEDQQAPRPRHRRGASHRVSIWACRIRPTRRTRNAMLFAPALPPAPVASPALGCVVPIFNECDVLPERVSRVPQPWISRLARAVGYAGFCGDCGVRDRIPGWLLATRGCKSRLLRASAHESVIVGIYRPGTRGSRYQPSGIRGECRRMTDYLRSADPPPRRESRLLLCMSSMSA